MVVCAGQMSFDIFQVALLRTLGFYINVVLGVVSKSRTARCCAYALLPSTPALSHGHLLDLTLAIVDQEFYVLVDLGRLCLRERTLVCFFPFTLGHRSRRYPVMSSGISVIQ